MSTLMFPADRNADPVVIRRVVVIGCGLIGTSVALALRRAGVRVALADRDPRSLAQAVRMGAGTALRPGGGPADVVVIATPPSAVAAVLRDAQERRLGTVYTDVASAKARILAEARRIGCDLSGYVPGHPMAGRELPGPRAARADLFDGRAWVVCPHPELSPRALRVTAALARVCGAEVTSLPPDAHDRAAAAVSHLPHVLSATLASRFADADAAALPLAGRGLWDVTRVAGGPAEMWRDILDHNAEPVAALLEAVARDLNRVAHALRSADRSPGDAATDVLTRGNIGRGRIVRAFARRDAQRSPRYAETALPAAS